MMMTDVEMTSLLAASATSPYKQVVDYCVVKTSGVTIYFISNAASAFWDRT